MVLLGSLYAVLLGPDLQSAWLDQDQSQVSSVWIQSWWNCSAFSSLFPSPSNHSCQDEICYQSKERCWGGIGNWLRLNIVAILHQKGCMRLRQSLPGTNLLRWMGCWGGGGLWGMTLFWGHTRRCAFCKMTAPSNYHQTAVKLKPCLDFLLSPPPPPPPPSDFNNSTSAAAILLPMRGRDGRRRSTKQKMLMIVILWWPPWNMWGHLRRRALMMIIIRRNNHNHRHGPNGRNCTFLGNGMVKIEQCLSCHTADIATHLL